MAVALAVQVTAGTSADSTGAAAVDSAHGNGEPARGEERVVNELLLKVRVQGSLRTVRKCMPKRSTVCPRGDQRRSTFLRNHAKGIVASWLSRRHFRLLYVFVLTHHSSRRLVHFDVTQHPTSAWTLQRLREAVGYEDGYRYRIHARTDLTRP